ncbi:cytochrome P450 [Phycomyces nitens]|nr:cytochrome P450 [Phycomyces nitens]
MSLSSIGLYADYTLDILQSFYTKVDIQQLAKEKMPYITFAVISTLAYVAYDKIFRPPPSLRHIPNIPYFTFMNSMIKGETAAAHSKRLVLPLAAGKDNNGFFVRPHVRGWEVFVANPEAVKQIFNKTDIFPKSEPLPDSDGTLFGKFIAGPNLAFLSGSSWKTQRKLINPAFHHSVPVSFFGFYTQRVIQFVDESNGQVNVTDLMGRLTLDVLGKTGFGFDFHATDDPNNEWVKIYENITIALYKPVWLLVPILERKFLWMFPERQKAHRDLDKFLSMLDTIIDKKHKDLKETKDSNVANNEKDLLTLMIEGAAENKGILSYRDLQSNICVFFLAGHETTSNVLAAALYYLAMNPELQKNARDEAQRILGDEPKEVFPTVNQTKDMEYITMVIKETLRMRPPAPSVLTRKCAADTVVAGVFIPKGTLIAPDIYDLHHNPDTWEDPETFNPERFRSGGEADTLNNHGMAWAPFGGGARLCIGMNFSLTQQRVVLSMLLRKYTWALPDDSIYKDDLHTNALGTSSAKKLEIAFQKIY